LKVFGFPPLRHPGDFRAVFSLPLNVSIRGPQYLKASGFPIKDFGNDGGGVTPEWFYQESISIEKPKKKQKHGCLIKDFRHDG